MLWRFRRARAKVTSTVPPGGNGYGQPVHIQFSHQELPSSGARQWSYDTLALPMYTPIGIGVANRGSFAGLPGPVSGIAQAISLQSLGSPGIPSGQFVTQPLLNNQSQQEQQFVPSPFVGPGSYALPRGVV